MKYYALMEHSLHGPFDAEALTTLPNFSRRTLVQAQERYDSDYSRWTEAGEVPLIALLMDTRDRGASHARSAAALDAFAAARRVNERETAALRREVVEGVLAQRAAMEGTREELAKTVARIAEVETALQGIKKAIYCAVAAGGVLGLALIVRLRPVADPRPERPAAQVPAKAGPESVPVAQPQPEAVRPAPVAAPKPVPLADLGAEAVALVRNHALPPASRFETLKSILVAERGWSEQKAVDFLSKAVKDRGGFEAVFPPYASARRLSAGRYEVELGRRDLLTPAVSVLLNADLSLEPAVPGRYLADMASRSVKPLGGPPLAPTKAEPAPDEGAKAVEVVRSYLLPNPAASRCPRTVEEALEDDGGPARTPQELVDCRAVQRFLALRELLSTEQKWSRRKALKFLRGVVDGRGGFEAVFPPYGSSRKVDGRTYEVELGRRDLLAPGLSVLLKMDISADSALSQRYEADLGARSVRPLPEP